MLRGRREELSRFLWLALWSSSQHSSQLISFSKDAGDDSIHFRGGNVTCNRSTSKTALLHLHLYELRSRGAMTRPNVV